MAKYEEAKAKCGANLSFVRSHLAFLTRLFTASSLSRAREAYSQMAQEYVARIKNGLAARRMIEAMEGKAKDGEDMRWEEEGQENLALGRLELLFDLLQTEIKYGHTEHVIGTLQAITEMSAMYTSRYTPKLTICQHSIRCNSIVGSPLITIYHRHRP